MRKLCGSFLILLLLTGLEARAQFDPSRVCHLEDGKLIISLDKRWTQEQKIEVSRLFDLDSSLVLNVYDGKQQITAGGTTWKITKVDDYRVEISKVISGGASPTGTGTVIMMDDSWINAQGANTRESEAYGVNRLTLFNVFNYHAGIATFFLPKRLEANQVYLSGTFNNWGTLQTPMMKTDSGWIVSIRLTPGKYLYKYILDGRWMQDPYNRLEEDDENGGNNSVIFCYNYRFGLQGNLAAKSVHVAGSFNNWNPDELSMRRVPGGWALYLFLREGTHAYKFIVDGQWILDPANKILRPDGSGHENSFLSIGDTMHFRLRGYTDASKVAVAGNFNGWNPNEIYLEKVEGGWVIPYVLAPGTYEYKFIVDGKWMPDPANPYSIGSGEFENSIRVIKPNHTFVLEDYAGAKQVVVTGSFTGWNPKNYRMLKVNDKWVFPIYLNPGKYTYKFIVDGKWMEDPVNEHWETNQYGTKNSILWIEP
ncbi:MAG TPA: glycogen-binding domain-containing protein [Bacteroidales bacterium]|nr:glycogen-binding domain-containing protein [Bacteroidales bacterium]